MTADLVSLDLNDLVAGKAELTSFPSKLDAIDFTPYKDKHVQLSGCAPTWAHLLAAAKLFPIVSRLDFIVDDGKAGKVVEIVKK